MSVIQWKCGAKSFILRIITNDIKQYYILSHLLMSIYTSPPYFRRQERIIWFVFKVIVSMASNTHHVPAILSQKCLKTNALFFCYSWQRSGFLKYWYIGAIIWNAREGRGEKIVTEMHMWCDLYRTFERICRWKINSTPLKS